MKINQVEELVDITKKNIRFYEDMGLLNPERNPENGYREYSLKDVDMLQKIKLLRKLSVPIEEIKEVQKGTLSFSDCMDREVVRLDQEEQSINVMRELLSALREEVFDFSSLNAALYLERMKDMEKGGASFMDISANDIRKKSKNGSTIAACVMSALCLVTISILLWVNTMEPMPLALLLIFIGINAIVIICIMACLRQRFKEIDKGEEYEARKY